MASVLLKKVQVSERFGSLRTQATVAYLSAILLQK